MTPLCAKIYIDLLGATTQTGDLKTQYGGGSTFACNLTNNSVFFLKGIYNFTVITHPADASQINDQKDDYSFIMIMPGIEYHYQVSTLPIFLKSSLGIGIGKGEFEPYEIMDPTSTTNIAPQNFSDNGLCIAGWVGLLYNATQRISPFLEIGYHYSVFMDDFKDADIHGIQVLFGVRFTVYGKNKEISSDY